MLMQHKFCCVNLIGRRWRTRRTWNMKQITTTHLGVGDILELTVKSHKRDETDDGFNPSLRISFYEELWLPQA